MVLLHMKIYIFHILKCNICTYITFAYGKDCYCISFCILTIFFWWTVKLLLLFQKVD